MAVWRIGRNLPRRDPNRLRRADKFTQLARHAFLAPIRILHQRGHAPIVGWNGRPFLRILQRGLRLHEVLPRRLQPEHDLRDVGALREGERFAFEWDDGHGFFELSAKMRSSAAKAAKEQTLRHLRAPGVLALCLVHFCRIAMPMAYARRLAMASGSSFFQ